MNMSMHRHERELTKGLVAGVAGGLLASFLMEQFQSLWTNASKRLNPHQKEKELKEDPATVKAAQAISTGLTHQKIPNKNKPAAGRNHALHDGRIVGCDLWNGSRTNPACNRR
jgi:hypothetical protein